MLRSLREAFRQAVENFHAELNRVDPQEETGHPLAAMQRELMRMRERRRRLASELAGVQREADAEEEALRTCLRREQLARRAGDSDTGAVAASFVERHRRRLSILGQKVEILALELEEFDRELEETTTVFEEARRHQASGSDVATRMPGAEGNMAEPDRNSNR